MQEKTRLKHAHFFFEVGQQVKTRQNWKFRIVYNKCTSQTYIFIQLDGVDLASTEEQMYRTNVSKYRQSLNREIRVELFAHLSSDRITGFADVQKARKANKL